MHEDLYYVYYNHRARGPRCRIHRDRCGECNHGRGKTTGTRPDNGEWSEGVPTLAAALEIARTRYPHAELRLCPKCLGAGVPALEHR